MNHTQLRQFLLCGLFAAPALTGLIADSPRLSSVRLEPAASRGEPLLRVAAADADGDLNFVRFSIASGGSQPQVLSEDVPVWGFEDIAELSWTPSRIGIYKVKATSLDLLSNDAQSHSTYEVFTSQQTIHNASLGAAIRAALLKDGSIVTGMGGAATGERTKSNAPVVFWSGGRATLKSGFSAAPGTFYWAAIDQEAEDEYDFDEAFGAAESSSEPRGSEAGSVTAAAMNGLREGAGGRDRASIQASKKTRRNNPAAASSGSGPLVLKLPTGYLGINTSTFEASVASAP